ncbi:MAG: Asp23/Gls24 family envelope stress response protein [Clostridiales bacterium]|nr:Asp23/Gls24 family envelope stress response protein [Clostridiales bacterium]
MEIVGFVGPSGTGKSHRATWVAKENGIEYIIDDGLLIKGNQVVTGISGKRESTRIASVKRALFLDKVHRDDVAAAIERCAPEKILIIGTSDEMVEKIAAALGIAPVTRKVYITEVASEFEIQQAINTRRQQGKHVIPVPTFEIKKDFSGYFLDPLQIFKRKGKGSYQLEGEKSVVRPTFSYLGNYTISDYTIYQIAEFAMRNIQGVSKVTRFRVENQPDGTHMEMDLVLFYGYPMKPMLQEIQTKVRSEVEKLTALNLKSLNLSVKNLIIPPKKEA